MAEFWAGCGAELIAFLVESAWLTLKIPDIDVKYELGQLMAEKYLLIRSYTCPWVQRAVIMMRAKDIKYGRVNGL